MKDFECNGDVTTATHLETVLLAVFCLRILQDRKFDWLRNSVNKLEGALYLGRHNDLQVVCSWSEGYGL